MAAPWTIDEATWQDIEALRPERGMFRLKQLAIGGLYIGIDGDGYRHLLLPLNHENEAYRDERSRGLLVQGKLIELNNEPERKAFLDVMCTASNGHSGMNLCSSDIVREVAAGDSSLTAVRKTLDKWRRFWGGVTSAVLSDDAVKGLFGELWFLVFWVLPRGTRHVTNWVGPGGSRHDFEWNTLSVEVKTTTSIRGHIHTINGLDQLQAPENGPLYLYSLRLRREQGAANSVPVLIDGIQNALQGEPWLFDSFNSKLALAGYSPVHRDYYAELRFRVVEERLFRVEDPFPRLTNSNFTQGLPQGIESLNYDVNLSGIVDRCLAKRPQDVDIFEKNV